MGIRIKIGDRFTFRVAGHFNTEGGTEPFEFALTARRLLSDELRAAVELQESSATTIEFVHRVVVGWSGVTDDGGDVVPYSPAALEQLLQQPGLANLIFRVYFAEVGPKEKN